MNDGGQPVASAGDLAPQVAEELRVLVVAGMATGVLVAGLGGRLAMLLLRLTSPAPVKGLVSDDGFVIGRVTLSGTYNLAMLGGLVGVIGAAAYQWVRPWLLGPGWLRSVTVALASGAVVGSMLIHADGIDFTRLKPTWLALTLFVTLPAVFALSVARAVDAVEQPGSWTRQGRRRWILPLVVLAVVPLAGVALLVAAPVVAGWALVRSRAPIRVARANRAVGVAVRAGWLGVASVGLLALGRDVADVLAAV